MSKEFNIDNYQYIEERITLSQWLQAYKPDPNVFDHEARFSGLLYEHEGEQWQHVMKQYGNQQWTLYREDDGELYIRNGLRVKGRIGYFITKNQHNAHATLIVTGISEDGVEHRICGI